MKNLIFIFLAVLIFGCKSPKIITEIRTETKWRDTTVYVEMPVYVDKIIEVLLPVHDTLHIVEKVYVDKQGYATMKSIHKETGLVGADISIYKGELKAELYLTDSTILYQYKDTLSFSDSIKIYNAIKETNVSTTNTVIVPPERYIPKFFKFTLWYFIFTVLAIVGVIAWKIKGGILLQKINDFIKKKGGVHG